MNYFETYATDEQKAAFENNIKKNINFGPLDSKTEKKSTLNAVEKLRKFAEVEPRAFCVKDYHVTYKVEECELIKIDGIDYYQLTISTIYKEPVVNSFIPESETLKVVVESDIKDKYFGNCQHVILSSTVQGLIGLATQYYQLSYTEAIPNIFADILTQHKQQEIVSLYINNIVKNAEMLYMGRFNE